MHLLIINSKKSMSHYIVCYIWVYADMTEEPKKMYVSLYCLLYLGNADMTEEPKMQANQHSMAPPISTARRSATTLTIQPAQDRVLKVGNMIKVSQHLSTKISCYNVC